LNCYSRTGALSADDERTASAFAVGAAIALAYWDARHRGERLGLALQSPATIEQAGQQAGYPAPPLQLTDELNLKLMQKVRAETEKAETGAGKLATEHTAYPVIDTLVEAGRPGRLEKAGFYDYDEDGKRIAPWEGLRDTFKASPAIRRHQPDRRASPDNRDRGHDSARSRRVSQLTRTAKLLPIHCPRVRAPNPQ